MKICLSLLIIISSTVIFALTPVTLELTDDSTFLYYQEFFELYEKENPEEFDEAEIYNIVDGNTVRANIDILFSNIRMLGTKAISTEENRHLAKDYLEKLLPKHVKISYGNNKFDTFGRLLSYIWIPAKYNANEIYILSNLAIVANGYAIVEENHGIPEMYLDFFKQAEEIAREDKLGLWKFVDTSKATEEATHDYFKDRKVVISYINYGEDPEYIKLKNISDETINLSGWRLVSRIGGQEYRFKRLELKPGYVVTLYSGQSAEKNVWTNQFIWNNEGDVAYLYDDKGNLVDIYHIN